jgi:ABC-type polysaccharide/polyol phosphate export permease
MGGSARMTGADKSTPTLSNARRGISELQEGAGNWRLWQLMGTSDIRKRYARSWLGQFWVTLSAGISITIIAVMWSLLWNISLAEMLPFLAVSLLVWQLLSGMIAESTQVFIQGGGTLLSQPLAFSTLVYAMVYRNFVAFAHNIVIVLIVLVLLQRPVSLQLMLLLPALAMIAISAVWIGCIIGMACTRYRDLSHAIQAVLQLAFYVTPVIWKPTFLSPDYRWLENINPFAIFIAILRAPLLDEPFMPLQWLFATLFTFGGLLLSLPLIGRYRRELLYWL